MFDLRQIETVLPKTRRCDTRQTVTATAWGSEEGTRKPHGKFDLLAWFGRRLLLGIKDAMVLAPKT